VTSPGNKSPPVICGTNTGYHSKLRPNEARKKGDDLGGTCKDPSREKCMLDSTRPNKVQILSVLV